MKKALFIIWLGINTTVCYGQYDWDGIDVPAEANNANYNWELVDELSDDFNYETPAGSNKGSEFDERWENGYINSWPGFGNTTWTPDNSKVTGGNLEVKATVNPSGQNLNFFSAIHSKELLVYPVYVETRMKVMNSVMANAVWMLSDNSLEEIDIVEAYGSSDSESAQSSKNWFAERMHLSHHTFKRENGTTSDYQPTDAGSYYRLQPAGSKWRDNFHTVGVYWRDPFHLEYYIDGELVRTVSGPDIIDPNEHLGGNGLTQREYIIVSGAAQGWQVNNGVWPTANELAVAEDNIFKVDWIRSYKRIDATSSVSKIKVSDKVSFTNPIQNQITVKANANIDRIMFYHVNGRLAKSVNYLSQDQHIISLTDLDKGMYIMHVVDKDGFWGSEKLVKQ
ncbi:T9SS type A sorting domain-containing protein [Labilibacter marinus]|uniref:T9SS type A sorting domain-containing protein n=1 Tax=Labilibacter marinus TaxID=1477105 RepID=UPI00094F660E|nr:T9SS type A sorting domain-containing protein [Labilibacter marinus]